MSILEDGCWWFAPSFLHAGELEASGQLVEGKALGTAQQQDLSLFANKAALSNFFPVSPDLTPKEYTTNLKTGLTVGRRKLGEVQERTEKALLALIGKFRKGKIGESDFRKASVKAMKTAWRDVYLAGIRAGGFPGQGAGKGKMLVQLSSEMGDEHWLKTAMQHEMRFLNKFLNAIVEDDFVMPLDRRARMYVNALTSFYESARMISLPDTVLIHWSGPDDKVTCPSCRYLFENSPYTKFNLPTTPRAGMTLCLTNCRDKLVVRRVGADQVQAVLTESKYTRGGHVSNLRKIKRTGTF